MKKITVEKSNKYIKQGMVKDFEFSKLPKENDDVNEESKPILDFSTFKRLFLSSSVASTDEANDKQ